MKTTARELRSHARQVLEAVERGEEVIITRRGKPCARVVPVSAGKGAASGGGVGPLFGIWRDHAPSRDVAAYIDRLRSTRDAR